MQDQELGLKAMAERFLRLRDEKRQLKAQIDELQQELDQVEAELVPKMQEQELQKVVFEGVGTVFLQTTTYPRVLKERQAEFIAWLDEHDRGELAKRTVNPQTLKAEYHRWEEEDLLLPPPELVEAYHRTEARVRKANEAKEEVA